MFHLIQMCDWLAVIAGRLLAFLAIFAGMVFGAAYLIDALLHRAGLTKLMLDFAFQECRKSPRTFWRRIIWGAKEE